MASPSLIPGGTLTVISSLFLETPCPEQAEHFLTGIVPLPAHLAHSLKDETAPKIDRLDSCTLPAPWQAGHFSISEVGSAPLPFQTRSEERRGGEGGRSWWL